MTHKTEACCQKYDLLWNITVPAVSKENLIFDNMLLFWVLTLIFCDNSHIHADDQPNNMLVDSSVVSAADDKQIGLCSHPNWKSGRGSW